jgi:hypothetical protein
MYPRDTELPRATSNVQVIGALQFAAASSAEASLVIDIDTLPDDTVRD